VTQDVKESLTAWITVSGLFVFGYVALRVMGRFPPPRWLVEALQGIQLVWLVALLSRWLWRRWRRRRAANGTA